MQAATVNDITLHYQLSGKDAAFPLVFINSLGTDFRIWQDVESRLRKSYRTLCYDKRGHGLSEAPAGPYTISDFSDDLIALLDHLSIKQVAVIGLSVGGMIAQDLALRYPDRIKVLVLCDTGHKIGNKELWDERIAAIRDFGLGSIADSILERWLTKNYRRNDVDKSNLWHSMLSRSPKEGYMATCAAIRDADFTDACTQITIPTLCICGEEDGATPPELVRSLADLIPHSRFSIIPGAGHLPCIEQAQKLSNLITEFLEEHTQ